MNVTLVKALVALVPACLLVLWTTIRFRRTKTIPSFLQVIGAGFLVVVVLTHVCEAVHVWPWMHWGEAHGDGHCVDLSSAVLGVTLLLVGYLFQTFGRLHT